MSEKELQNYQAAYEQEKQSRLETEKLLQDKTRELELANQRFESQYQTLTKHTAELELFLSLTRIAHENTDFKKTMERFVNSLCILGKWPLGHVYVPKMNKENGKQELVPTDIWFISNREKFKDLYDKTLQTCIAPGTHLPGKVFSTGEVVYIEDISKILDETRAESCKKSGILGTFGIPIKVHGDIIAIVEIFTETPCQLEQHMRDLIGAAANQVNLFLERQQAEAKARENHLKLQQALIAYQQLAHTDPLTKLANRFQFDISINQGIQYAKNQKTRLALLYIDLDYFKTVNDTFGHDVGDLLLQEVANRLRSCVRIEDIVARLGGDEFAVIINNFAQENDVENIAKHILEALKEPYKLSGHDIAISASIGIACYPEDGIDSILLAKNADIAMYNSKLNRRGNYQRFKTHFQDQYMRRLNIESALPFALSRREFFLVYQPTFELSTHKMLGMEVLLRWQHPTLGLISPQEFIPIAEEMGVIDSLGKWVLQTACEQYMKWRQINDNDYTLMINISIKQFSDETFFDFVKNLLEKTGMPAKLLELELTESEIMGEQDKYAKTLLALHGLGIQLAIDDFGTGYSSLGRLKQLPVTTLKIDRSFIKEIDGKEDNKLIVDSIIKLANALGLNLIAEGVETKLQEEFLRKRNCQQVQGYYYQAPLSASEMDTLLKQANLSTQL